MEDRGMWLRRLGPHQLASDCPVILLTHLRKALNDPLSAGNWWVIQTARQGLRGCLPFSLIAVDASWTFLGLFELPLPVRLCARLWEYEMLHVPALKDSESIWETEFKQFSHSVFFPQGRPQLKCRWKFWNTEGCGCREKESDCINLIETKILLFCFENTCLMFINHLGLIGGLTLGTLVNKMKQIHPNWVSFKSDGWTSLRICLKGLRTTQTWIKREFIGRCNWGI